MITQLRPFGHVGSSHEPMQKPTQVPSPVCCETFQHIAAFSQLSTPLTPPPLAVHASPGLPGFGITSVHFVAFHEKRPSLAHGMHFWLLGQSCANRSHSKLQSKFAHMVVPPVVLLLPMVAVVEVVVGSVAAAEVVPAESVPVVVVVSVVASVVYGLSVQPTANATASGARRITT